MKNVYFGILLLALTTQVSSQTPGSGNTSSSSEAKSGFINNQDYLSTNTLNGFKSNYGDSLNGFDEQSIKASLITKNVYGEEYLTYIKQLKRNYINQKYKIGINQSTTNSQTPLNPIVPNSGGGKTIGGGNNIINVAPCVNEDFELTTPGAITAPTIQGWSIESQVANICGFTGPWTPGSNEFSIATTPILNYPGVGTIPTSPLGGSRVALINNFVNNSSRTKIKTTFPVTATNALFQFAFAGVYENAGHSCCEQPGMFVQVLGCNNQVLSCSSITLSAGCQAVNATFTTGTAVFPNSFGSVPVSWTNWQVKYIDLTPYIGTCVTFECWTTDCIFSGHRGSTVFDARCGGQFLCPTCGVSGTGTNIPGPVSFCAGSGLAQISAPLGYASYTWQAPAGAPPINPAQINSSSITIANPVPGSIYTVQLTSPSGCAFTATNAIVATSVGIVGLGTTTTCAMGASGSASVIGFGSAAGYNYTWTSGATNAVVGTGSAVTGLGPGIYSINISGLGSAGCGTDASTVAITVGPPTIVQVTKPFCGNQAFLTTSGGSNFKWYNGNTSPPTALTGTAFTANSQTVNSPGNGQLYWLSYLSNQGCQDSVKFILVTIPPGITTVTNVSMVCPGVPNGTATIIMAPAAPSPFSIYSFSVSNANTLTPIYSASLFPTSALVFTVGGLSAGSYVAKTFDGSCAYTVPFNVNALVYNYTVTPGASSLCPSGQIAAGVTFTSVPSPSQYSYSWTPSTWLAGGNTSLQNTIISPSIAPGPPVTVIYSITVTPSLVNCPITKTLAITAINPPTPSISPIPNLCNISAQQAVIFTPPGGTFTSVGPTPTSIPVNPATGVITPNLANIGAVNTLTYSISQGPCVAKQTANYHVSLFHPSTLTSSVSPLCVTNPPVNLMSIVQSTVNGKWISSTIPMALINNSFSPLGLTTNAYAITYSTSSTPTNLNTCPSVTNLTISVTNTITPVLTLPNEFCTNAAPFTMTATLNGTVNPPGGVWASSAISSGGTFSPALSSPTNNIINYTVTDGPCVNTNSIALNISQYNTAAFTSTIPALCGLTGAPFNLMSVVVSTVNGFWMAPQGIVSNSFFPGGIATNTYVLTYSTNSSPNATLCSESNTTIVSVLNPPIPTISQIGPFCSINGAVQMSVTPNIGNWTSTGYLSPTGMLIPSLCVIGNNPIQYIIGTPNCNSQQTKFISVEAFASAATTGKINDLCNTSSPVNLQPITQTNLGVWSGAGISGTSFNPATVGAGSFVLTYNTASYPSGLCPDQSTIAVNVFSLAAPAITSVERMCNSAPPRKLLVSPVGGLFGSVNSNAVSFDGVFNPALGVIGNNIINYSITSGPCVAYGETTIIVEKFISADLVRYPKSVYCQTIDKPINLNELVANPGGEWSGTGIIPGSSMFNPDLADVGVNHVFTYQTHSLPTKTLCPHVSTVAISVGNIPTVSVVSSASAGCAPFEVALNVLTNVGKATWLFGDGSEPVQDFATSHVFRNPGTYTATLSYVSALGCPAKPFSVNPFFNVLEAPVPDFYLPEEVLISNPQVQITNLTTGVNSNKYEWRLEGNSTVSRDINPVIPFAKIGRYNVTLIAESADGCKAQMTRPIDVRNDFNVFIPSSFSPNFDNLNDVFMPIFSPYGLDTKSFDMEIFDRWGHSLFRSKDPAKGWDGSVNNKGEPLKEEVYLYKIKYKDLDGNIYNKMGHVSLLR